MINALRNFSRGTEMEKAWKQLACSQVKIYSKRTKAGTTTQLKSRADEIWAAVLTPNNIKKCSLPNSSENSEKWITSNRAVGVKKIKYVAVPHFSHQGEKFLHKSTSCLTHFWIKQVLQNDRIKQEVHQANLPNISSLSLVLQWSKDASNEKAGKENKEWS